MQILERYLYFYDQGVPASAAPLCAHPPALTPASAGVPEIEARIMQKLLERVQGCMSSIELNSEVKHMHVFNFGLNQFTGGHIKHRASGFMG